MEKVSDDRWLTSCAVLIQLVGIIAAMRLDRRGWVGWGWRVGGPQIKAYNFTRRVPTRPNQGNQGSQGGWPELPELLWAWVGTTPGRLYFSLKGADPPKSMHILASEGYRPAQIKAIKGCRGVA